MLQFIYHPDVKDMLERFHPSVGQTLGEAVASLRDGFEFPVGAVQRPADHVSEEAVSISIFLFGKSTLLFFVTVYLGYHLIFFCVQTDNGNEPLSPDQIDDAQNALYLSQQLVDRTMPI